jgi:hypothetical protein
MGRVWCASCAPAKIPLRLGDRAGQVHLRLDSACITSALRLGASGHVDAMVARCQARLITWIQRANRHRRWMSVKRLDNRRRSDSEWGQELAYELWDIAAVGGPK